MVEKSIRLCRAPAPSFHAFWAVPRADGNARQFDSYHTWQRRESLLWIWRRLTGPGADDSVPQDIPFAISGLAKW